MAARINIYLSDDMAERVKKYAKVVNWSSVAQAAFAAELEKVEAVPLVDISPKETLYIRLPARLKRAVEEAAASTGLSANEYVVKLLRETCGRGTVP